MAGCQGGAITGYLDDNQERNHEEVLDNTRQIWSRPVMTTNVYVLGAAAPDQRITAMREGRSTKVRLASVEYRDGARGSRAGNDDVQFAKTGVAYGVRAYDYLEQWCDRRGPS